MARRVKHLSEQLLLKAGVRALNLRGLEGLRRVLVPEALESASSVGGAPTVSRHSAYRLWSDRDQAVADVARHVFEVAGSTNLRGVAAAIEAYDRAERPQGVSDVGKDQGRKLFREVMRAYLDAQFRSEEYVAAAWGLQVAAITCSPVWKGTRPDSATLDLGREVLAARASSNEAAMQEWAVLVWASMALFGRRPSEGRSARDIALLLGCMVDGTFLRMFVDGDVVSWGRSPRTNGEKLEQMIEMVCDAMFELIWACSEPGLLADPRRPDSEDPRAEGFDSIVTCAIDRYSDAAAGEVLDPACVATEVGQDEDLARQVFPTPGDLADSILRALVGRGAEDSRWKVDDLATWVETILHVVSVTASSYPALVAAAVAHPPTAPSKAACFIAELKQTIHGILVASPTLSFEHPSAQAENLVELSLHGQIGWIGAKALLENASLLARGGH